MIKFKVISYFVLLISLTTIPLIYLSPLPASSNTTSNFKNANLQKHISLKHKPVNDTQSFLVTRTIDIKEMLGPVLYYSINRRVYDAALSGEIPAYKDSTFEIKYTHKDLLLRGSETELILIAPDVDNPNKLVDTIIQNPLREDEDITSYSITEKITFLPRVNNFTVEVIAFGLNSYYKGYVINISKPLFWISTEDFIKLFTYDEMRIFNFAIYNSDILKFFTNRKGKHYTPYPYYYQYHPDSFRIVKSFEGDTSIKTDSHFINESKRLTFNLVLKDKLIPYRNDSLTSFWTKEEFKSFCSCNYGDVGYYYFRPYNKLNYIEGEDSNCKYMVEKFGCYILLDTVFDYSFEFYLLSNSKNYFAEGHLRSLCPALYHVRFNEFSKHVPTYISIGMMNLFMANLRLKLSSNKK